MTGGDNVGQKGLSAPTPPPQTTVMVIKRAIIKSQCFVGLIFWKKQKTKQKKHQYSIVLSFWYHQKEENRVQNG